jgi:hypothetical protein
MTKADFNRDAAARAFWEADLCEVERVFLGDRDPLTFRHSLLSVVPPQGSVILDRVVNIDTVLGEKPTAPER